MIAALSAQRLQFSHRKGDRENRYEFLLGPVLRYEYAFQKQMQVGVVRIDPYSSNNDFASLTEPMENMLVDSARRDCGENNTM